MQQRSIYEKYRQLRCEYGERERDIYVSTYSRSGTTWMQLILYQLTTEGSMDFEHIFEVSPWLYYSALRNMPAVQVPDPRILKTHDEYEFYSPETKGRFVYVLRDGRDVLNSFYFHKKYAKGYTGSFDEHVRNFIHNTEYNWFRHVRGWLENRHGFPILYVKYEDLVNDLDTEVGRIADFCGIVLNPALGERVRQHTSFTFMKQHEMRLGPRPEHFAGLEYSPYRVARQDRFIRRGLVGEGAARLSARHLADYRRKFDEVLGSFAGIAEYRGKDSAMESLVSS